MSQESETLLSTDKHGKCLITSIRVIKDMVMLVIKDLFRGMMLKSKESHIKIAGHSKCLAISFVRKRNVRCFAWNGKEEYYRKKEELYPIKPKTLYFRYLNCRFR